MLRAVEFAFGALSILEGILFAFVPSVASRASRRPAPEPRPRTNLAYQSVRLHYWIATSRRRQAVFGACAAAWGALFIYFAVAGR